MTSASRTQSFASVRIWSPFHVLEPVWRVIVKINFVKCSSGCDLLENSLSEYDKLFSVCFARFLFERVLLFPQSYIWRFGFLIKVLWKTSKSSSYFSQQNLSTKSVLYSKKHFHELKLTLGIPILALRFQSFLLDFWGSPPRAWRWPIFSPSPGPTQCAEAAQNELRFSRVRSSFSPQM